MEEDFKKFIGKLISECLQSESIKSLDLEQQRTKITEIQKYLQIVVFETLIDNLAPHQIRDLDNLDFSDPETDIKIAEMSATIPNFGLLLQTKLQQEADQIKATGTIPDSK